MSFTLKTKKSGGIGGLMTINSVPLQQPSQEVKAPEKIKKEEKKKENVKEVKKESTVSIIEATKFLEGLNKPTSKRINRSMEVEGVQEKDPASIPPSICFTCGKRLRGEKYVQFIMGEPEVIERKGLPARIGPSGEIIPEVLPVKGRKAIPPKVGIEGLTEDLLTQMFIEAGHSEGGGACCRRTVLAHPLIVKLRDKRNEELRAIRQLEETRLITYEVANFGLGIEQIQEGSDDYIPLAPVTVNEVRKESREVEGEEIYMKIIGAKK